MLLKKIKKKNKKKDIKKMKKKREEKKKELQWLHAFMGFTAWTSASGQLDDEIYFPFISNKR